MATITWEGHGPPPSANDVEDDDAEDIYTQIYTYTHAHLYVLSLIRL